MPAAQKPVDRISVIYRPFNQPDLTVSNPFSPVKNCLLSAKERKNSGIIPTKSCLIINDIVKGFIERCEFAKNLTAKHSALLLLEFTPLVVELSGLQQAFL